MGLWDAKGHFRFAYYPDPDRVGVGVLRVQNDDTSQSQMGFDSSTYRDVETAIYVREGAINHEDNRCNKGQSRLTTSRS